MDPQASIDLSAGLQPKQASPAPAAPAQSAPQPDASIDLSAGLQPKENTAAPSGTWFDRTMDAVGNSAPAQAIADASRGFVKSASQTLLPGPHTAAAINNATGLNIPADQDSRLNSISPSETVGKVGENIMEFLTGDEALKGLSMAKRFNIAAKVADIAESSPAVARLLHLGMTAARQGTVAGVQDFAKGDTATGAAQTGATAGALGAGVGAATEGIASTGVGSKIKSLIANVPKATESRLITAIGDVAEKAGFERSPDAENIVEATKHLATSFQQRASSAYKALDEAAPGFQELKDKIAQETQAVRVQQPLDPEKADTIAKSLAEHTKQMQEMLSPEQKAAWQAADKDYSQYKALQQFAVKSGKAAGDLTSDSLTDVNKLKSGMQSLSNSARKGTPVDALAKGFGEEGANNLREIVEGASKQQATQDTAKKVALYGGATGVAGVGGEYILHKLLGFFSNAGSPDK